MLRALYYPHTQIQDATILKNALLLWDSIDTIVPTKAWRPPFQKRDKLLDEAAEIVVRRRVPNLAERNTAHASMSALVSTGVVDTLVRSSPESWRRPEFLIHPEKFLHETWRILERAGTARWVEQEHDFGVPAAVGLLMMSLLADACAGTQIQKVTDRVDAYSWLTKQRASALESPYVLGLDVSQVAPSLNRLVTLTMDVLDGRSVPLKKLVALRKREAKTGGAAYATMRRNYMKTLQAHLERISKEVKSPADFTELDNQFRLQLEDDLKELKSELQLASLKTLFSEKVALSALILAGTFLSPLGTLTALGTQVGGVGVIPLMKSLVEYKGERRKVLKSHFMSWLFLGTKGPITLY
jgi:hypothetical protein